MKAQIDSYDKDRHIEENFEEDFELKIPFEKRAEGDNADRYQCYERNPVIEYSDCQCDEVKNEPQFLLFRHPKRNDRGEKKEIHENGFPRFINRKVKIVNQRLILCDT